jgi:DeoR/GlpR family transcriptional regulator of sugar metabolism
MNTRQSEIVDLLQKAERLDVRFLAERFDVSQMTIRRDLKLLEEQGFLVRTHGGGIPAGKLRFLQSAFPHYTVSPQKAAIGRLAAGLIAPKQLVMIEAGTTSLEVARNIPRNCNISVATTSLCVLQELYGSPMQLLLLGGYARSDFPSVYGPMTEAMLKSFHVDILFIGCDGADSKRGFYASNLLISSLEQEMIDIASRVVVVTESWKFGRKGFVRFATPEHVHTVVTDANLSPADRENLASKGVKVLIAEVE